MSSQNHSPENEELLRHLINEKEMLQKSVEELSLLLNSVPVLIWAMTDEQTFGSVNKAFADFFGKQADELIGKNVSYLVDDYVTDITISTNKIVFQEKKPYYRQGWVTNYKGEKRFLAISKTPIFDEKGNVGLIICNAEDITEKENAKKALHENTEIYRLIFENSPIGILHYDKAGNITACNDSLVQIFQSSSDTVLSLNLFDIIYVPQMRKEFESTLHGKYAHYEGEFTTPISKVAIIIEADFAPIFSQEGVIIGGIGIIQNLSDKRKASFELMINERKYRELLESINDLSWLVEGKRFLYVNNFFKKYLKISTEDLNNDTSLQFKSIHPDDIHAFKQSILNKDFVKNKRLNVKFRIIKDDGSVRWLWVRSYPIFNESGEVYRIAGIATDITDEFSDKTSK